MSKLRSPFLPTKETLGIVRHIEAEAMVPYCRVIIKNEITLFSPQYRSTGLAYVVAMELLERAARTGETFRFVACKRCEKAAREKAD